MARKAAAPTRRRNYGATGHGYFIDGREVSGRGVTSLIKTGMPNRALQYWAARTVAEAAVDEADTWEPILRARGRDAAIEYLKESPWQVRNKAGATGTSVHTIAERLARGEEVDVGEVEEGRIDAFLAWWDEWTPSPLELEGGHLALEVAVINRRWQYGGTIDLIADLPGWKDDGSVGRVLVDYKTARSGVWPEDALQVGGGYLNAEVYLPAADGSEGERPLEELGLDGAALLHLASDGEYRFIPVNTGVDEDGVDHGANLFRDFLYVVQVAEIVGVHKNVPGRSSTYLGEPITPGESTS